MNFIIDLKNSTYNWTKHNPNFANPYRLNYKILHNLDNQHTSLLIAAMFKEQNIHKIMWFSKSLEDYPELEFTGEASMMDAQIITVDEAASSDERNTSFLQLYFELVESEPKYFYSIFGHSNNFLYIKKFSIISGMSLDISSIVDRQYNLPDIYGHLTHNHIGIEILQSHIDSSYIYCAFTKYEDNSIALSRYDLNTLKEEGESEIFPYNWLVAPPLSFLRSGNDDYMVYVDYDTKHLVLHLLSTSYNSSSVIELSDDALEYHYQSISCALRGATLDCFLIGSESITDDYHKLHLVVTIGNDNNSSEIDVMFNKDVALHTILGYNNTENIYDISYSPVQGSGSSLSYNSDEVASKVSFTFPYWRDNSYYNPIHSSELYQAGCFTDLLVHDYIGSEFHLNFVAFPLVIDSTSSENLCGVVVILHNIPVIHHQGTIIQYFDGAILDLHASFYQESQLYNSYTLTSYNNEAIINAYFYIDGKNANEENEKYTINVIIESQPPHYGNIKILDNKTTQISSVDLRCYSSVSSLKIEQKDANGVFDIRNISGIGELSLDGEDSSNDIEINLSKSGNKLNINNIGHNSINAVIKCDDCDDEEVLYIEEKEGFKIEFYLQSGDSVQFFLQSRSAPPNFKINHTRVDYKGEFDHGAHYQVCFDYGVFDIYNDNLDRIKKLDSCEKGEKIILHLHEKYMYTINDTFLYPKYTAIELSQVYKLILNGCTSETIELNTDSSNLFFHKQELEDNQNSIINIVDRRITTTSNLILNKVTALDDYMETFFSQSNQNFSLVLKINNYNGFSLQHLDNTGKILFANASAIGAFEILCYSLPVTNDKYSEIIFSTSNAANAEKRMEVSIVCNQISYDQEDGILSLDYLNNNDSRILYTIENSALSLCNLYDIFSKINNSEDHLLEIRINSINIHKLIVGSDNSEKFILSPIDNLDSETELLLYNVDGGYGLEFRKQIIKCTQDSNNEQLIELQNENDLIFLEAHHKQEDCQISSNTMLYFVKDEQQGILESYYVKNNNLKSEFYNASCDQYTLSSATSFDIADTQYNLLNNNLSVVITNNAAQQLIIGTPQNNNVTITQQEAVDEKFTVDLVDSLDDSEYSIEIFELKKSDREIIKVKLNRDTGDNIDQLVMTLESNNNYCVLPSVEGNEDDGKDLSLHYKDSSYSFSFLAMTFLSYQYKKCDVITILQEDLSEFIVYTLDDVNNLAKFRIKQSAKTHLNISTQFGVCIRTKTVDSDIEITVVRKTGWSEINYITSADGGGESLMQKNWHFLAFDDDLDYQTEITACRSIAGNGLRKFLIYAGTFVAVSIVIGSCIYYYYRELNKAQPDKAQPDKAQPDKAQPDNDQPDNNIEIDQQDNNIEIDQQDNNIEIDQQDNNIEIDQQDNNIDHALEDIRDHIGLLGAGNQALERVDNTGLERILLENVQYDMQESDLLDHSSGPINTMCDSFHTAINENTQNENELQDIDKGVSKELSQDM